MWRTIHSLSVSLFRREESGAILLIFFFQKNEGLCMWQLCYEDRSHFGRQGRLIFVRKFFLRRIFFFKMFLCKDRDTLFYMLMEAKHVFPCTSWELNTTYLPTSIYNAILTLPSHIYILELLVFPLHIDRNVCLCSFKSKMYST